MMRRLLPIAFIAAATLSPESSSALDVRSDQDVYFDFQLSDPSFAGPYDRVGFRLESGGDLRLSAFDEWDVELFHENRDLRYGTARFRVDFLDRYDSDVPLDFFSIEFIRGLRPSFSGTDGTLGFLNPSGAYSLGQVEIFLMNSELSSEDRVEVDVTHVRLVPEPGAVVLLGIGLVLLAAPRNRI